MLITDPSYRPTVTITFKDQVRTLDIEEARNIRNQINEQITEHESEGVIAHMLNSVGTIFRGGKK